MKSRCNMSKVTWFFRLLVIVLGASTLTAPLPADAQGSVVSLSGVGTATIDGQLAPGEQNSSAAFVSSLAADTSVRQSTVNIKHQLERRI